MLNGLGLGGYIPETQFAWYCGQGFIGYQAAALISQNWLVKKACAMPAKDASRNGYELSVNDGTEVDAEVLDYIREQDKKFEVLRNCVEFIDLGRTFGIRVAMFMVDSPDPEYYTKPFNPDGVKPGQLQGHQPDRPLLDHRPSWAATRRPIRPSPDFYEPTWWRINGKRVHRTHLVIFRNGNLPDILKPAYLYGGLPVPQLIAERVYAAERTANEAPMLAMTKRLTVLKCDITQAVANPDAFNERMTLWTQLHEQFRRQDHRRVDDEVQQFDTSLADLDAVIMTQYQLVAAAAEVPGDQAAGHEPEGIQCHRRIRGDQLPRDAGVACSSTTCRPLVERHHLLLIRSHVAPKFKMQPFNTEVRWNRVDEQTAAEQADIEPEEGPDRRRATCKLGAIDGFDIRSKLIADKESGFNGMEPVVPGGPGDRDAELEAKEAEQSAGSEDQSGRKSGG